MKQLFLSFFCLLLSLFPCGAGDLPAGIPEEEGVSSRSVLDFITSVERNVDALHSFVYLRHGKVISEGWWAPYAKEKPHMLYSLSKSFTSTAIGIAVDEGRLGLDDKVISFFPDQRPEKPSENLQAMRIRDLLCMGTGHHNDTLPALKKSTDADWIKVFLAQPVEHKPGTHFRYNTGATYILSAILQKVTGEKLLTYLTPRLFEPLGIKNPTWETSAQGVNTGGYGLKVTTKDIAKLGQLYLQKGMWQGKRLVSSSWVETASAKQIENGKNPRSDWNQGYGFHFWRCRHNAYRGDGAFGQYCVVMPDQDAVLAITSGLGNMQQVMDLAWKHLLPGMKKAPLGQNLKMRKELRRKTNTLKLDQVQGKASTPMAADIFGQTYSFEPNEKGLKSISLQRDKQRTFLLIKNDHGDQRVDCGFKSWEKGRLILEKNLKQSVGGTNGDQSIAVQAAWTGPDRFSARMFFDETPFLLQWDFHFKGEQLDLGLAYNVMFGPKKWQFKGRVQSEIKQP